ncbi:hypothetical protein GCK72_025161 [Caenorhabditis remanei]|uniref:Uncharacterized protein n=1 Tax=Caenorhabditis remanei TaxID=31234 RepID=E3MZC1_CAERE|nr:hypothetical protein GCK72_025161 [Caenorhabditis remanei]EFP12898.1 hypothetical protein CRE_05975 [Caenorhabditis remanei]KAF1748694.1 hypothetical protein GCK72_025161 [Caenorhabditis remanei]
MDLPRGDQSYNVQKKKELSESLLEMILDTKFTDVAQILKGQNLELIEELVCKDPYILHKAFSSYWEIKDEVTEKEFESLTKNLLKFLSDVFALLNKIPASYKKLLSCQDNGETLIHWAVRIQNVSF